MHAIDPGTSLENAGLGMDRVFELWVGRSVGILTRGVCNLTGKSRISASS